MIKKLLFCSFLAGAVTTSLAQHNIQLQLVSPTHNSQVVPQSPQPIVYRLRNLGPHAIPQGRVIHMSWINYTKDEIYSMTNVVNQSSGYQLNEGFLDPGEMELTANIDLSGASVGDVIMIRCWGAFVGANLDPTGDPNDTDMTNNYKYFRVAAAQGEDDDDNNPGEGPSVSILEVLPAEVVIAFPNPASDRLEIVSGTPVREVKIIDTNGAVVSSYEDQTILNIENLQGGTYFYQVTTIDNNVVTKKFIKN